jgi:hypothetical protein
MDAYVARESDGGVYPEEVDRWIEVKDLEAPAD